MIREISKIKKRDGRIVDFDKSKISNAIWKAVRAVGGKDKSPVVLLTDKVVEELKRNLKENEIPTVEQVQDVVEKVLIEEGHARVAKAYILYRQKRAEIRQEKAAILEKDFIDEVDKNFDVNALRVLKSRYLRKGESGKLVETPKQLFTRIAIHAALPDLLYDESVYDINSKQKPHEVESFNPDEYDGKLEIGGYKLNKYHLGALKRLYDYLNSKNKMKLSWGNFLQMLKEGKFNKYEKTINEFFDVMTTKKFMPNTPAIANFGASLGLGSACFVLDIEDSLDSIMETLVKAAKIFQAGGGLGYNFSKLRPEGDFVSTTGGKSSGPISFMTLYDKMTDVIKQGGCVSTDTLVRTDKGLLPMISMLNSPPLKDNPTNYFVFDGKEYNHAWLAQNNGIASVYNIKTELGNELDATGNHLMAVATEKGIEWKAVDKLQEGDWLITVLGGHKGSKIRLPEFEKQHHNANKLSLPEYLNEELAELLGLYIADGCFNGGRFIITVNSEDTELTNRIEYLMKNLFNLNLGEKRGKKTYFDLVFFSKDLEKYFEALKWKKHRSYDSFIPEGIMQSEEKVVCAFLRGLFEGDGSVHKDGSPILYSTSPILINQAQQLLLSLGIVSKKHEKDVKKWGGHYGKRNVYTLTILTDRSVEIFRNKIGFITQKKNKLFEKYFRHKKIEYSDLIPSFSTIFKQYYATVGRGSGEGRSKKGANLKYYKDVYHYLKGARTLTRRKLQRLLDTYPFLKNDQLLKTFSEGKYFFNKITSVTNGSEKYTMEIEVPASSSYIANGFLVHNIRRGANMGILNSNHPDIEKFIKAKEGNKVLRNFNISVLVMPDFWEYYEKNKPYPLINPRTKKVVKYINPRLLFDMIAYQAWESAEPGVIFFDHVNKYNPFYDYLGPIVTTNPCGEVLLYPNESCNLGSINVWKFVKRDEDGNVSVDWDDLEMTVKICTKFLDNVIDINKYPLDEIRDMTFATRKIGLGIMGVADMLFELSLAYNSDEGRKFMEKIMEFVNYWSKVESIELAKERGPMPYFDKSFYKEGKLPFAGFYDKESWNFDWNKIANDIKKFGIRNGYTTVIAPTGSISMIAGCSSGIEPVFTLVYEKNVTIGSFFYIEPVFERAMIEEGLYDEALLKDIALNRGSVNGIRYIPPKMKKVFVTAMDISPEDHIKALASFQKWVDSSISKTNNFPANATVDDVKKAYMLAYKLGCKDVTVFRDMSIQQQVYVAPKIEKKSLAVEDDGNNNENNDIPSAKQLKICPECSTTLIQGEGCVTCPECGWGLCK